jgi:hypothetical protein
MLVTPRASLKHPPLPPSVPPPPQMPQLLGPETTRPVPGCFPTLVEHCVAVLFLMQTDPDSQTLINVCFGRCLGDDTTTYLGSRDSFGNKVVRNASFPWHFFSSLLALPFPSPREGVGRLQLLDPHRAARSLDHPKESNPFATAHRPVSSILHAVLF